MQITGAFRSIQGFIQSLGHRVLVYYAVPEGCWTDIEGIPANRINKLNFLEISRNLKVVWYIPQLLINTLKLRSVLKRNSIQVVHVNDLYNMVGVCLKILHPSIKLVYHVRLRRFSYAQSLFGIWVWALKVFADVIVCVSHTVERDLGISSQKVEVIYDVISNLWHAEAKYLNRSPDEVLFLYVGNYIPGKGQDYALRAFEIANKEIKHIKLKFIGSTGSISNNENYLYRLKEFAQNKGLEEFVEFRNRSINISSEMAASDVILNFSESESFSMVCLEALASKRAIIATRSGGPEEIIRHNVNGVLVENRDVVAMAEAIVKLGSDPKLREKLSKNAYIDFDSKFSLSTLSDRLYSVYTS